MDRKTKTITLPSGKTAEVKEFLNARERNVVRASFLESIKVDAADLANPETLKNVSIQVSAAQITEANERAFIEQLVVSYDGGAENILDRILDGSPEDYDFLLEELRKLGTGGFQMAK